MRTPLPLPGACSLSALQKDSQGFGNWNVVDVRTCFVIVHEEAVVALLCRKLL